MLRRSWNTNNRRSIGVRRHLYLASITLSLALAGCGSNTPDPVSSTTPSTASTTDAAQPSTPPDAVATSALDAYRGMWRAYVEAIHIPDPNYPDLARYTQGDALQVFVTGLTNVQNDGLVGEGDVTINPRVVAERPGNPSTVDIEDCVDTSQSQLVKRDGSPYQDSPGGRQSARATATEVTPGAWKVTSFALFGVGTC